MIQVLFEDNHLLVVLKPQNVPSQPDESGDVDLLTLAKQYIKEKYNKPGEAFVGLVHRLDRPTGGVMVFAKTSKCAARLSEQMKTNDMQKLYLAVVEGIPKQTRGTLVHYLLKNERKNVVEVVPQTVTDAKRAELAYQVLQSTDRFSLVKVALMTGRSHQIRAQFKHIGHPLFGDTKYGSAYAGQLALWAYELTLIHPVTKVKHTFKAYPPKDQMPWQLFASNAMFNE